MAKSALMKLRDKADAIARDKCRARGVCEAAGLDRITCRSVLQWAHIVERSERGIRWEPMNCLALCAAHHIYYTYRPFRWQLFVQEHFPNQYAYVKQHINDPFDGDYEALIARLEAE